LRPTQVSTKGGSVLDDSDPSTATPYRDVFNKLESSISTLFTDSEKKECVKNFSNELEAFKFDARPKPRDVCAFMNKVRTVVNSKTKCKIAKGNGLFINGLLGRSGQGVALLYVGFLDEENSCVCVKIYNMGDKKSKDAFEV
jgi:hypothetical protein